MPQKIIAFLLLPVFIQFSCGLFIYALRGNTLPSRLRIYTNILTAIALTGCFWVAYSSPHYLRLLWNPMHLASTLLVYPLLFFYLFYLINPEKPKQIYWIAFYAPSFLLTLLFVLCRYLLGAAPELTDYSDFPALWAEPEIWIRLAGIALMAAEIVFVVVLSVRMLIRHRQNLKQNFSYTEGISLGWVFWLLALVSLYGIATLLMVLCVGPLFKVLAITFIMTEPVVTTVLVLKQKDLYRQPAKKNIETMSINADIGSINPGQPQRRDLLKQNLIQLLEKEEIFTDPELNSEKVREMLGTNRTYLSQIINQELDTDFYTLVNNYRLKKAVAMMKNPQHAYMPLTNIAEICGFKSLGAFSTFFRQSYGMTPTEWRKNSNYSKEVKL